MPALRRTTLPVLIVFLGLLWPATGGAAQPTVAASADVGTVAVAQAIFRTRGGGKALPRLARPAALPSGALVVGGVKKVRRGRYLASLAVVRPSGRTPGARAAAAAAVRARLRMPRGARFAGFVSRATASDVANRAAPRSLCRALPRSFSHGAPRPLAGTLLSGFDARTTLRNAFWLGCRDWAGRAEFINALGARGVTASPTPPADSGGGSAGGEDEAGSGDGSIPPECQPDPSVCDPEEGPPKSTTLTGSGSVTRDAGDPNLYRYSVQFNEPIRGYRFEIARVSLECPTDKTYHPAYSKCQGIPDAQRPSAGGADLRCTGADQTNHLLCAIAQSRGGSVVTVPAGTTITGSFTVDAGSVSPGSIQVYGENAQGGEAATPFALAGPG